MRQKPCRPRTFQATATSTPRLSRPELQPVRFCLLVLTVFGLSAFQASAAPASLATGAAVTTGDAISAGLRHILPAGKTVILFLLAIFLASPKVTKLLGQVFAYAFGHSITLWLVALGLLTPSAHTVAWLVPASLVIVAVENLLFGRVTRIKYMIVFIFGLIHGLGFGLYASDLGITGTGGLIGFNLGLEVAIAAVIGLAFASSLYFRGVLKQASRMDLYRPMIVVPVSLAIAVAGLLWTIQAF